MIEIHAARMIALLAGSTLKAAAVILAVALFLRILRRLSAQSRAAIWFAAVLAGGAMPFFALVLPSMDLGLAIEPRWLAANELNLQPGTAAAAGSPGSLSIWSLALGAYGLGAVLILIRFLLQIRQVGQLARRPLALDSAPARACLRELIENLDLCRNPRLLYLPNIRTPVTWGLIRPRIGLPREAAAWPNDRLRNALIHELAHIKRCDWHRLSAMRLVLAMHWFNPLVWYAVRRCEYQTELACDPIGVL